MSKETILKISEYDAHEYEGFEFGGCGCTIDY
jgi:hypothetical protein